MGKNCDGWRVMARLTKTFICDEKCGRDSGKHFFITEMPAAMSEEWGYRAMLVLINAGIDIPKNAQKMGMMAVLSAVLTKTVGNIDYSALKPLLDELLSCIKIIPDIKNQLVMRELIPDDIEEPLTLAKLRKEALMLHLDFLKADK
jgi:hypothetical protein